MSKTPLDERTKTVLDLWREGFEHLGFMVNMPEYLEDIAPKYDLFERWSFARFPLKDTLHPEYNDVYLCYDAPLKDNSLELKVSLGDSGWAESELYHDESLEYVSCKTGWVIQRVLDYLIDWDKDNVKLDNVALYATRYAFFKNGMVFSEDSVWSSPHGEVTVEVLSPVVVRINDTYFNHNTFEEMAEALAEALAYALWEYGEPKSIERAYTLADSFEMSRQFGSLREPSTPPETWLRVRVENGWNSYTVHLYSTDGLRYGRITVDERLNTAYASCSGESIDLEAAAKALDGLYGAGGSLLASRRNKAANRSVALQMVHHSGYKVGVLNRGMMVGRENTSWGSVLSGGKRIASPVISTENPAGILRELLAVASLPWVN